MTMATIANPLAGDVRYDCPSCGTHHEGPIEFTSETEARRKTAMEEMWPGGPLVENTWATPEYEPGERTFSFSCCPCVFNRRYWNLEVLTYADGRPSEIFVRAEGEA